MIKVLYKCDIIIIIIMKIIITIMIIVTDKMIACNKYAPKANVTGSAKM